MLLLQEFEFDIHHQPGVQHVVVDYLSQLESREPTETIYDDLPYTNIFGIDPATQPTEPEDGWINKMVHFLSMGLPPEHLPLDAKKWLAIRSRNFCLFMNTLHRKGSDGIWHRAVRQFEKDVILREAHYGIVGGHYVGDAMAQKICQSGLWWPTTKKDAHEFYRQCDLCQRMGQPSK